MSREIILKSVFDNPGATLLDIEQMTRIERRRLARRMSSLLADGYLAKQGEQRVPSCTKPINCYVVGKKGLDLLDRLEQVPSKNRLVNSLGQYAPLGPWAICAWNLDRAGVKIALLSKGANA